MKRNYGAFIFRLTCAICVLNVVRYYAVKGIETHGNLIKAFNSLFPWDNPLSSTLKIVTIVGSISLLVVIIKICINGLKAPRLNWKEGLNELVSTISGLIGIIAILCLYIVIWGETKSHINAFAWSIIAFVFGSIVILVGNSVCDRIVSKFQGRNNDEYYENNEEYESDEEYE